MNSTCLCQEYHRFLQFNGAGRRLLIAGWVVRGGRALGLHFDFIARLFRVSPARVETVFRKSRACNRRGDYSLVGLTAHRTVPTVCIYSSPTLSPSPLSPSRPLSFEK